MIDLRRGDCLKVLPTLADGSVDMVLADPPYGVTACHWDTCIPLAPLWEQLKRVIKPRGAVVLTASQPFTTDLICSNRAWFKYCWVWVKSKPNGWQHAKNRPMQTTEDVVVFSPASIAHSEQTRMTYIPQGVMACGRKTISSVKHGRTMGARPKQIGVTYQSFTGFPSNVLKFRNLTGRQAIHPTQKPVAIMEYLVRTYTNEGETVLDFCMGSGTTGVACLQTGRKFIGIEKDAHYFQVAQKRISAAQNQREQAA